MKTETVVASIQLNCSLENVLFSSFFKKVIWSGLPCDNFHLLIACSILESQRGELIGSDHDFNTILKVSDG